MTVIDRDVLDILRQRCAPEKVRSFARDLNSRERWEKRFAHEKGAGDAARERALLDALLTFCTGTLRDEALTTVLTGVSDHFARKGKPGWAGHLLERAVAGSTAQGGRTHALALLKRGELLSRQGLWREAALDLGKALMVFRKLGDADGKARVENILGTNAVEQGILKDAIAHFERALSIVGETGAGVLTGTILMNLGIVRDMLGERDDALSLYQRARVYFAQAGDSVRLAEVHHNTGMTHLAKGDITRAAAEFEQSYQLGARQRNVGIMGLARLGKATVHYQRKDLAVALRLVDQAMESFTATNDQLSLADGYKMKGMIHREMRKFSFAETYLQTSLRVNQELHNVLNIAETYDELGILARRRSRKEEALLAFRKAREQYDQLGAREDAARMTMEIRNLRNKR